VPTPPVLFRRSWATSASWGRGGTGCPRTAASRGGTPPRSPSPSSSSPHRSARAQAQQRGGHSIRNREGRSVQRSRHSPSHAKAPRLTAWGGCQMADKRWTSGCRAADRAPRGGAAYLLHPDGGGPHEPAHRHDEPGINQLASPPHHHLTSSPPRLILTSPLLTSSHHHLASSSPLLSSRHRLLPSPHHDGPDVLGDSRRGEARVPDALRHHRQGPPPPCPRPLGATRGPLRRVSTARGLLPHATL
jgi:hypothetical protein